MGDHARHFRPGTSLPSPGNRTDTRGIVVDGLDEQSFPPNTILGYQSGSGRWGVFRTPMVDNTAFAIAGIDQRRIAFWGGKHLTDPQTHAGYAINSGWILGY